MRKTVFFLAVLLAGLVGCQPGLSLFPASDPPDEPALPLTGANASRLGAAALVLEEDPGTKKLSIVPVSADTGRPLEGVQPVVLGGAAAYGFSKDRSQMVFLSNQAEGCTTYCLHVMDLQKWEEMFQPIPLEKIFSSTFLVPAFDANSARIPVILNRDTDTASDISLVDRAEGKVVAKTSLHASLFQVANTPAGDLAVYGLQTNRSGSGPLPYLALLDGDDLSVLWEQTIANLPLFVEGPEGEDGRPQGQYFDPAAVFSKDGGTLYLVAADRPLLLTIDFQNQTIDQAKIQPRASLLERLLASTAGVVQAKAVNGVSKMGVLSADGRYLYVAGQESKATDNGEGDFTIQHLPMDLQVIDTRDGALVRRVETRANRPFLSPDGKTLLLNGWQDEAGNGGSDWTEIMDTTTWEVTQRLEGSSVPSRLLDGSLAWLVFAQGNERAYTLQVYRPGETTPRSQISQNEYVDWIPIP